MSKKFQVYLKSFVAYNNIPNISVTLNNSHLTLFKHIYKEKDDKENEVTTELYGKQDSYLVVSRIENVDKKNFLRSETRIIVFDTGCYELKDIASVIERD